MSCLCHMHGEVEPEAYRLGLMPGCNKLDVVKYRGPCCLPPSPNLLRRYSVCIPILRGTTGMSIAPQLPSLIVGATSLHNVTCYAHNRVTLPPTCANQIPTWQRKSINRRAPTRTRDDPIRTEHITIPYAGHRFSNACPAVRLRRCLH